MNSVVNFDPEREANELREQLSTDKRRIAFFFGAGTSQAVGLPGIIQLTESVSDSMSGKSAIFYNEIRSSIGDSATVEDILNSTRVFRQILRQGFSLKEIGMSESDAECLDREICRSIYEQVSVAPTKGMDTHVAFGSWLRSIERECPVEIFTTNYDLLVERGFEISQTPHFDGFIGTVEPYFSPASVEADFGKYMDGISLPRSWVRVWKLHGSIGWRVRRCEQSIAHITRTPLASPGRDEELMIFPSSDKYIDSRKQPFMTYQDRLRKITRSGEVHLVVAGYSFSDQHINEILFEGLRSNNRLSVTALVFDSLSNETIQRNLISHAKGLRNLTVYGPQSACVGGLEGDWKGKGDGKSIAWDGEMFKLGDFSSFVLFLKEVFYSRKSSISGADVDFVSLSMGGKVPLA